MKNLLTILLLAPAPAFAGVGVSAQVPLASAYGGNPGWFPITLDYRNGPLLAQIHVVDVVEGLPIDQDFYLATGVDVTNVAWRAQCAPEVEGVVMPGGSAFIVFDGDDFGWMLLGEARFGAEMKKGSGFGVYVVPQLGFAGYPGDITFVSNAQVQLSWWMK